MKNSKTQNLFREYPGVDRFAYPEGIYRVTAGKGGEAILVMGEEYTALYDTGMAYCAEGTIANIRKVLQEKGRETLDFVLVSHTHYDHIGALPYVLKAWPKAVVCGAAKAGRVFASPGALKMMKRLGEEARDTFVENRNPIETEGMRVDRILTEGSVIHLGGRYFRTVVTKGHTDCSLAFLLEPDSILFASESTGLLSGPGMVRTAILKSYRQAEDSARRCKALGARHIITPHFGWVPDEDVPRYFNMFLESAAREKDFVLSLRDRGMDFQEIMQAFEEAYWFEGREKYHPKAAFLENAGHEIACILKEFPKEEDTE